MAAKMPRGTKKSNEDLMRGMRRTYGGLPEFEAIAATIEVWPEPKNKAGKKRSSASHAEEYVSDDGFVANGSDDGGPNKKAKTTGSKARTQTPGNKGGEEFWEAQTADDRGDQLTGKRRVQVSEFKGMQMVNIREFYEKDGEMLPGKKGISLTVPQYNALLGLLPQIETSLAAKGETVVRPNYEEISAVSNTEKENGRMDSDADGDGGDNGKVEGKKNFEATSEEEN